MRLAAGEYDRFAELLESLTREQWSRHTDCPAWDVRQLASHVLGMAAYASSIREGRRQQRLAHKGLAQKGLATHGGDEFIDVLTDLQVRERAALTPAQITTQFHAIGPKAAKGRRRTPAIIRRRPMPEPQTIAGISERWTIGFVTEVILTRDVWMHRVDLCRATGRPLRLSADHDGELIADVVLEWAGRHRQPFRLHLTGPAGGTWSSGADGETLELDAVEFCRILSERKPGTGLLATPVPF
ncbi:MAG: maleylpyruvate isomerase family mycothiol-dependent enzyme [Rhodococcus sp. (in: high G+C Gram-positive bacteria)]|nr:MAG: maleylpyruvate isomerase family mycothiol-dependent enzyme [Rhodococcus sp. (in: high G+C Gram-positive bacteria)]